ncbi:MAG TPA: hypothetical protein VFE06_15750 [Acidobacteriaceae bacterium]|nr:hypothetical protein [Acidobacteriaceae bacterium]
MLSYALACPLHGKDVSKLALGFATRGFSAPALREQLRRLAVEVEAQFGAHIGLFLSHLVSAGEGTDLTIAQAPLAHTGSALVEAISPRRLWLVDTRKYQPWEDRN